MEPAASNMGGHGGSGGRRRAAGSGGGRGSATGGGKRRFRIPGWKWILGVVLLVCGGGMAACAVYYMTLDIPSPNPSTQAQDNVFYWSDGTVLGRQGSVNRQNVTLGQVPAKVQWDFLAAENRTFYTDKGVDPLGMVRAVYHMASGGDVQSGSTITQQFVKNAMLSQQQTVSRKFKEIMISLKIGSEYSKQQILQGYLNSSYYGRGANGIEAAAEAYYHVHASQLTVSQGAFIASTVNEPSVLMNADSDAGARAAATNRWQYVLGWMKKLNKISPAEYDQIMKAGFPVPKPQSDNSSISGQKGYLMDTAAKYVEQKAHLTEQQFSRGGYQVYTTFDRGKVNDLQASVNKMQAKHLNTKLRSIDKNVQVGAASVDPTTGALVAIYGGAGFDKGHYSNNADAQGVPVGSTFKPIVLAAALENGAVLNPGASASKITPDSKFNGNDLITIKNQAGKVIPDSKDPTGLFHQKNDVATKYGFVTLNYAMQESINTPYVQLGEYTGYDNVEKEALSAGLLKTSLQYDTPGFYIGTSTPSAIRMADAYATFANQGLQRDPYSVTKVLNSGKPMTGFDKPKTVRAMPSDTANTVTKVLQNVVQNGTGSNAKALGRPVAGKTGTTDEYKSAWFIGYTPQLVTSVSMFREDPKHPALLSMKGVGGDEKVYGANMPTEVWTNYMQAALHGKPVQNFPQAPDLGKGADENGASPSPSPTPTDNSPTPSPTPSATDTGCPPGHGRNRTCPTATPTGGNTPDPTPSATDTSGGWCGLITCPGGNPTDTSTPTATSSRGKGHHW
ncbi:transglycosylase domain-containing protein [Mangrovactinospora gilvigrisea]|uniref:transglycosylase domain-containing protein n=1 Tax=Mangrovactinospora gilvigrisea TaxID=1428644 RepID=UPI001FE66233|nr:transglycosylase domain-containing protein [Mangrovactinospora gilvigrisea]